MSKPDYYSGVKNRLVRYYFYVQRGLALLNEARYLVMAILAVYYALKLTNPWILVAMFAVSVPVLVIFGYVAVHHMGKTLDFLNVEHATHWSRYNYTLLEQIRDELRKSNRETPRNIWPDFPSAGDVTEHAREQERLRAL